MYISKLNGENKKKKKLRKIKESCNVSFYTKEKKKNP